MQATREQTIWKQTRSGVLGTHWIDYDRIFAMYLYDVRIHQGQMNEHVWAHVQFRSCGAN